MDYSDPYWMLNSVTIPFLVSIIRFNGGNFSNRHQDSLFKLISLGGSGIPPQITSYRFRKYYNIDHDRGSAFVS